MRQFPAYTYECLLETAYCHVLKLFNIAKKAEALFRLDPLVGALALNEEQTATALLSLENQATAPDAGIKERVMTPENKLRAQQIADRIAHRRT